jgi:hypothetical protein
MTSPLTPQQFVDKTIVCCFECCKSIIAEDDDALVCIQCGGRNRLANTKEPRNER